MWCSLFIAVVGEGRHPSMHCVGFLPRHHVTQNSSSFHRTYLSPPVTMHVSVNTVTFKNPPVSLHFIHADRALPQNPSWTWLMWQLTPNRTRWPTTKPSSSGGLVTWGSTGFNIHIRACAEWISLPDDICPPIDPNLFFRIRTLEISHKTASCSTLPI